MSRSINKVILLATTLLLLSSMIAPAMGAKDNDLADRMKVGDDASDLADMIWAAILALMGLLILYLLFMNFLDYLGSIPRSVSEIGPWFWGFVTSNFKLLLVFVAIFLVFMIVMNSIFGLGLGF